MAKGFKDKDGKFRPTASSPRKRATQFFTQNPNLEGRGNPDSGKASKLKEQKSEAELGKEARKHFDDWDWKGLKKRVEEETETFTIDELVPLLDPESIKSVGGRKFKAIVLDDLLTITDRAFESGLSTGSSDAQINENELKFEIAVDALKESANENLKGDFGIEQNVDNDLLLIKGL